ncbi:DUF4266 domain-containing protein [Pedobacter sp. G11]|uniref:DUF4266 domain-containing protein n=1 Tax=Pedobacter sp. G11 TaxID=2482728 RepID=UPI000F5FCCC4|nr:DUF4266 domain-containing protein [Pedobacter sp. G11]AZI26756.1 DUF4266 domain-containing protein [Pedobacter sp. G11]
MKSSRTFFLLAIMAFSMTGMLSACSSVKPYQKSKLNDADMTLSARKVQKFEQGFQLYREGGSGANGGKSGGGCGCN